MKRPLQHRYEKVVETYVAQYCKKHGLEFRGWYRGNVGFIAELSGRYVPFLTIRKDIDKDSESVK